MDVSNDNNNQQENVCFVCRKIGSNSESSSDLGEIIKVMRGIPTLRNASAERKNGLLEFLNSSEFVYAHSTSRQKYIHNKYIQIQCGNFKWNKYHNLDIGNFCKKIRNRSIFVFPCPHFGVYGFCISVPGSQQPR
jgi:hypothetical protein